jgi:hypothetical protein
MAEKKPKQAKVAKRSRTGSVAVVYHRAIDQTLAFKFPGGCTTWSDTIVISHQQEKDLDELEPLYEAFVQKHGGCITIVTNSTTYTYKPGVSVTEPTGRADE